MASDEDLNLPVDPGDMVEDIAGLATPKNFPYSPDDLVKAWREEHIDIDSPEEAS